MRLRGRKGIRDALVAQPELIVLNPKEYKGNWAELFGNHNPIHVELGMGKGQFISRMSMKYPDWNFIGVDMYDELLRRASEKARLAREEAGVELPGNLRLALFNIEYIEDMFDSSEIERIYLNFSDPWPKKKHARRRLTHERFVETYKLLLNANGEIHLKTDSRSLFEFSLNSFADLDLAMRSISLDLHAEGPHPDHIMTEYESKFVNKGMNIHRCEVVIGERALRSRLDQLKDKRAKVEEETVNPVLVTGDAAE